MGSPGWAARRRDSQLGRRGRLHFAPLALQGINWSVKELSKEYGTDGSFKNTHLGQLEDWDTGSQLRILVPAAA